jgi:hypothetical protein
MLRRFEYNKEQVLSRQKEIILNLVTTFTRRETWGKFPTPKTIWKNAFATIALPSTSA